MAVRKEMAITAAAIAAAGVLVAGVTAVSNASTTTQVANTGYSMPGQGGYGGQDGDGGRGGMGQGGMGGHSHTAVTGTELAKVKAAVKAKDSSITVTTVMKDADGSYDVFGTKSGSPVRVEVSKDLKTIEVRTGGPGGMRGDGDHGAMGGHSHTAVTGTELAKVKAAVKAKDSSITVTTVMKDADGSYDVFGTKSGSPVRVEVSKDLKTIEVDTGGPGGMHGGDHGTQQQAPSTGSSSDSTASTTSDTSTI
ncbi:hypothetical protein [Phycicoccus sp. SLBN-51]|uniref:hypothetical protein n=1 Tax=Phycicoccus sp. SLBN-51 TaxID=2768447 RepID=UPI001154F68E|nr:hypothetical protein [Phycicoccus sp. SLBN-51]TQJ52105.1 hypothetical protein FBY26_3849 [Phycicoccus sp. SLBN-51]